MNDIVNNSLSVNLKVLRILQFSADLKQQTALDKALTYVMYVSLSIHVPILCGIYLLLEQDVDSIRAGDDALTITALICYAIKLLYFIWNREKIVDCIHFLNSVEVNPNKKQKEMLGESVKICKRNSYIFLTPIATGLVFWTMKPILLGTYTFPLDIWFPGNLERHAIMFWIIYVYVALGSFYPNIVTAAMDPLVANLACLASGHLRVLKDELEFLEDYANEEMVNPMQETKSEILYRKVENCIIFHNKLLYFTGEIEQCFSFIVFTQFIGSVISISFCCFHLSVRRPFSSEFFTMLNYLFILLAQIYFFCFYGTELNNESTGIMDAIYNGRWYKYDVKLRNALLIMMERSKKPIVITAGKLFEMSLESFTTILRRSYSLLAVLKNQE